MDITWNGDWFYANRSHASVDRYIALGLHELGHNVRVTNIVDGKHFNPKNEGHKLIKSFTEKEFDSDYNIYKFPSIKSAKEGPKFNCLIHGDGSYTFSVREKGLIEPSFITHLWLPTPEQAEIVDRLLSKSVVSPGVDGGIDPKVFNLNVRLFDFTTMGIKKETFKFVLACDGVQSTSNRPFGSFRGSDIAIESFMGGFSSKDHVCLIIKAVKGTGIVDSFIQKMEGVFPDHAPIIKDYGMEPHELMAKKWKACDCMINPIRDCRWEMCCLESLAVGTPCIATYCGGPKRYGKEGIYFVQPSVVDGDLCRSRGDVPLSRDYWTEPSVKDFREKMRRVYENKAELKPFGIKGSKHVLKNWRWVDMSQRIVNFFEKGE